jgi:hypothetical protein
LNLAVIITDAYIARNGLWLGAITPNRMSQGGMEAKHGVKDATIKWNRKKQQK